MSLVDKGADGTAITSSQDTSKADIVTAYFLNKAGGKKEMQAFADHYRHSSSLGDAITDVIVQIVPDKNWTQSTQELLQPLTIDSITVIPISSVEDLPSVKDPQKLYIIPGMGFGTGHHPTTQSIISLLQSSALTEKIQKFSPLQVFDFGTGSGLLAIAIQQLYPAALITAIDNDFAALENAQENAHINNCGSITFIIGDSPSTDRVYQLIVANIYAEVLVQHESALHNQLSASGILILSGIMNEKQALIDQQFTAKRWRRLVEIIDPAGWTTRAYVRT